MAIYNRIKLVPQKFSMNLILEIHTSKMRALTLPF